MQIQSFFFFTIFVFNSIYNSVTGSPIIGVQVMNVRENEYRFVVAIAEVNPNCTLQENIYCSGSLITNSHVLSADHCMDDVENHPFKIHTGSNNITCTTPYLPLSWINFDQWATRNNKTNDYSENDITIIKVIGPVTGRIPRVILSPIQVISDLYEQVAIMVGWGEVMNNAIPQILKKANVNIITNEQCVYMLSRLKGEMVPVPEEQYFCSQNNPYIHMGDGDSGGPLIYNNRLIAINKALCPDIDFHRFQINAFLFIDLYREYITAVMSR